MERLTELWNRFRMPTVVVAILAATAAGVLATRAQGEPLLLDPVSPSPSPGPSVPATIVVDIEGAVAKPGVRELPGGSLVADAVKAAGGFTQDADRAWVAKELNQAEELKDHQKVYVPLLGEMTMEPVGSSSAGSEEESDGLVDLNTADIEELDTLPGVGEATAEKIIDYREAFGPFGSVDDLLEVSGIGEAKLEKLRDKVTV
ncbi:MAG TPA: ComEA family DNA-binding protein [Patescibacteria group bacterium]